MMLPPTFQDVTYRDYPIQFLSSASTSVGEIDTMETWGSLLSSWIREQPQKKLFYHNFIFLLEVDWSSVWPHFGIKNETSQTEEMIEETVTDDMLEFDIVVRMQPLREWSARARVESVKRAVPHIVEPEGM